MWSASLTRGIVGAAVRVAVATLAAATVGAIFIQPLLARSGRDPRSVCQSNLKQLAMALQLYWGDYDAMLPSSILYIAPANRVRATWDGSPGGAYSVFASEKGILPPPPTNTPFVPHTWPMLLYPFLTNKDAIWCPSDRNRNDDPAQTAARVSYYWKAAIDRAWFGDASTIARKEGDFRFPADQVIFYEHNGWHWGESKKGLIDGVRINCAFLDGRVAAVEIGDSGYTREENPPEPLPVSGVGEPAWFNYSYGDPDPDYSVGRNWDPAIWGDNLPEVEQPRGQLLHESLPACQSNLLQLAMALAMYIGDYDATLPSSIRYGGSETWNSYDFIGFASERGTLPPRATASRMSWPMLLYPFMREKGAIWCPADRDRMEDPSARVSYYWKAAVDAAWYGGPDGTGPRCWKEGDFNFPADQIIFYEHNGWHFGGRNRGLVDDIRINCAFLDGHVAAKEIRDSGYTHRENPPEPLPVSGVGEPAWFNYSYGGLTPAFSIGQNWNPKVWGDNLP